MTSPIITYSRRQLLKSSFSGLGILASSSLLAKQMSQVICATVTTPTQTKGPFYPLEKGFDQDNDLTFVAGKNEVAQGTTIYIKGQVTDVQCRPIPQTLVEIWQACESGRYSHVEDTNPAPLDPHFQYFGKCMSDENGFYQFKTILPGNYPADEDWIRPSHIHFRVIKKGYFELITQLYFEGNPYNQTDLILNSLSATERNAVIAKLQTGDLKGVGNKKQVALFNITLKKPK